MDDMKRATYMLALEKISNGKKRNPIWVCLTLKYALMDIIGTDYNLFDDEELMELFPEFFQLYDGRKWDKGARYIELGTTQSQSIDWAWWKSGWKKPRIRILNCILCHH